MVAMYRSFADEDLVQLPRMSVVDGMALATALVSRADAAGELPGPVGRARDGLRAALDDLRVVAQAQAQEAENSSKQPWDRAFDATWAAAYHWCRGWRRLPHPEHAAQVEAGARIETALFSEGLRFTRQTYHAQWAASQTRLDRIENEGMDQDFATLGGQPILDAIRKAHDDFGRAMGLTEASDGTTETLRDGLDRLRERMRRYVLQLVAHADPEAPETEALADDLLLPLTTWKTRSSAPAEEAAPAPGEPVTPPESQPGPAHEAL